jgi:hypothetical protein
VCYDCQLVLRLLNMGIYMVQQTIEVAFYLSTEAKLTVAVRIKPGIVVHQFCYLRNKACTTTLSAVLGSTIKIFVCLCICDMRACADCLSVGGNHSCMCRFVTCDLGGSSVGASERSEWNNSIALVIAHSVTVTCNAQHLNRVRKLVREQYCYYHDMLQRRGHCYGWPFACAASMRRTTAWPKTYQHTCSPFPGSLS